MYEQRGQNMTSSQHICTHISVIKSLECNHNAHQINNTLEGSLHFIYYSLIIWLPSMPQNPLPINIQISFTGSDAYWIDLQCLCSSCPDTVAWEASLLLDLCTSNSVICSILFSSVSQPRYLKCWVSRWVCRRSFNSSHKLILELVMRAFGVLLNQNGKCIKMALHCLWSLYRAVLCHHYITI